MGSNAGSRFIPYGTVRLGSEIVERTIVDPEGIQHVVRNFPGCHGAIALFAHALAPDYLQGLYLMPTPESVATLDTAPIIIRNARNEEVARFADPAVASAMTARELSSSWFISMNNWEAIKKFPHYRFREDGLYTISRGGHSICAYIQLATRVDFAGLIANRVPTPPPPETVPWQTIGYSRDNPLKITTVSFSTKRDNLWQHVITTRAYKDGIQTVLPVLTLGASANPLEITVSENDLIFYNNGFHKVRVYTMDLPPGTAPLTNLRAMATAFSRGNSQIKQLTIDDRASIPLTNTLIACPKGNLQYLIQVSPREILRHLISIDAVTSHNIGMLISDYHLLSDHSTNGNLSPKNRFIKHTALVDPDNGRIITFSPAQWGAGSATSKTFPYSVVEFSYDRISKTFSFTESNSTESAPTAQFAHLAEQTAPLTAMARTALLQINKLDVNIPLGWYVVEGDLPKAKPSTGTIIKFRLT